MATTVIDPKVSAKPNENLKLQISRVIHASRQRAFDAWTRPEYIRQWFGGNSRSVASIEADVRESGAYCFKVSGGTGPSEGSLTESDMARDASISGRYVEVNPYDLLSFTWVGDWDPTEETLVTVTFKDVSEGTEVAVTHERFASELSRSRHEMGWTDATAKMAKFAESNL